MTENLGTALLPVSLQRFRSVSVMAHIYLGTYAAVRLLWASFQYIHLLDIVVTLSQHIHFVVLRELAFH